MKIFIAAFSAAMLLVVSAQAQEPTHNEMVIEALDRAHQAEEDLRALHELPPILIPELLISMDVVNADEDVSGDVTFGDTLTYTITATSTGTADLTNIRVNDSLTIATGGTTPCELLLPTESCTRIGKYIVTANDVTAGQIDNTGTGTSDQTEPNSVSRTVMVVEEPTTEPSNVPAVIAAMPTDSWIEYGRPWDDVAPTERVCGKPHHKTMTPWVGWARDGLNDIYLPANGGHADGCDNGVYGYDIQTGTPYVLKAHTEFNADLEGPFPFVAAADGTTIIVPHSTHSAFGHYIENGWIYLVEGSAWKHGTTLNLVWRFHIAEKRWEPLPKQP